MPTQSPRPLAQQLLRAMLGELNVSDRDLLARFATSRDEEAFAEIVRRHGPMVLAVCRRVTGRPHDAEDAFQAAFLVLARRANHIDRPELLANWLYGVAYRTALEARSARRRAEEHIVPVAPEPAAPQPPEDVSDLRCAIDEELAKLPEKYGTAIVLCDLEGLSRADAAARMGIPQGTLSSRLAHGRKLLANRLARRGVTASTMAVAAVLGHNAMATIPHTLMNSTILAAMQFSPGGAAPLGVSPSVSSLTEGVLKTMLVTRLRQLFAVALLTCGLIGVGAALAQQFDTTLPPPQDSPVATNEPISQQPAVPKKQAPLKSVAKGVEDEDVPYTSTPKLGVVRLEDGKLIVRQRSYYYAEVPVVVNDGSVMMTQQKRSGVNVAAVDAGEVAVFDMKGNRLPTKEWKEMLKTDRLALISADGSVPNPRELALFKPDTLLLVVPQQTSSPPAGGFNVGGFTYSPLPKNSSPPAGEMPGLRPNTYVLPKTYYEPVPTAPAPGAFPPDSNLPTPTIPQNSTAPLFPDPLPTVPPSSPPPNTSPTDGPIKPRIVPSDEPLPIAPKNIRGTVLSIDAKSKLVKIDVGSDAGLKVGDQLTVFRPVGEGARLGVLVVGTIGRKEAMCEFKPFTEFQPAQDVPLDKLRPEALPRKGDTVMTLND